MLLVSKKAGAAGFGLGVVTLEDVVEESTSRLVSPSPRFHVEADPVSRCALLVSDRS